MSKIILITGGSSGIGAACARHAVKAGHKVVLTARSEDKLNALVAEMGADNALGIPCDVSDPDAQKAMFEKAVAHYGKLDVVFANAGIGATAKGTENGNLDNFKEMIIVNNFAVTVTAHYALPHLKASKGHLVLTGSLAGHINFPGSVYGATKWFIRGYAENLAAEVQGTGVRVTNINPGQTDTPFFDNDMPDALRDDDIAGAFMYAIEQPPHARVASMLVYPTPKKPFYDPYH